jgi:hypothetical protein
MSRPSKKYSSRDTFPLTYLLLCRFISDKCCGLLLRARKYKLLDFEGEMLFQVYRNQPIIL